MVGPPGIPVRVESVVTARVWYFIRRVAKLSMTEHLMTAAGRNSSTLLILSGGSASLRVEERNSLRSTHTPGIVSAAFIILFHKFAFLIIALFDFVCCKVMLSKLEMQIITYFLSSANSSSRI